MCYQAALYCSDQGADLGQHVEGLDKYMTVDYLKAIEDVQIITENPTRRSVYSRATHYRVQHLRRRVLHGN